MPSLFRTSTLTGSQPSPGFTPKQGKELDLRAEFDKFVFGDSQNIPHGKWLLVRHMRRDANGKRLECTCLGNLSRDPSPTCPYCLGEGFLWDEKWYLGYSMYIGPDGGMANKERFVPAGIVRVDDKVFYLRYDTPIKHGDKIIEPLLDTEGKIKVPYRRVAIYMIETLIDYRADNGRIEYWAAFCKEKDAIRPDVFEA